MTTLRNKPQPLTDVELAKRQGALYWKSSEEIRGEIARAERLLADLRTALRRAQLSASVQEAMQ